MTSEPLEKAEVKPETNALPSFASEVTSAPVELVEVSEVAASLLTPELPVLTPNPAEQIVQNGTTNDPELVPLPGAVNFRSRSLIAGQKLSSCDTQSIQPKYVIGSTPTFFKPTCKPGLVMCISLVIVSLFTDIGMCPMMAMLGQLGFIINLVGYAFYLILLCLVSFELPSCVFRVTGAFSYDSTTKKRFYRAACTFYALLLNPYLMVTLFPPICLLFWLISYIPPNYWLGGVVLKVFGVIAILTILAAPVVIYRFMMRSFDHFQGHSMDLRKKRLISALTASTSLTLSTTFFVLVSVLLKAAYGVSPLPVPDIPRTPEFAQPLFVVFAAILSCKTAASLALIIPFWGLQVCLNEKSKEVSEN